MCRVRFLGLSRAVNIWSKNWDPKAGQLLFQWIWWPITRANQSPPFMKKFALQGIEIIHGITRSVKMHFIRFYLFIWPLWGQPHWTSRRPLPQFSINSPIVSTNPGHPVHSLPVWLGLMKFPQSQKRDRITRINFWQVDRSTKNKRRVEASLLHSPLSFFRSNHWKRLDPLSHFNLIQLPNYFSIVESFLFRDI